MDDEKNNGLHKTKTRLFPIVLGAAAGLYFKLMGAYFRPSALFSSLGELMLLITAFLLAIAILNRIKLRHTKKWTEMESGDAPPGTPATESSEKKRFFKSKKKDSAKEEDAKPNRVLAKLAEKKNALAAKLLKKKEDPVGEEPAGPAESIPQEDDAPPPQEDVPEKAVPVEQEDAPEQDVHVAIEESIDGLIDIKKIEPVKYTKSNAEVAITRFDIIGSLIYVLFFIGLVVWFVLRIPKIQPWTYADPYQYGLLEALQMLAFLCVTITYLRMRKDEGSRPADTTSQGIFQLLSLVTFIYAVFFTANSVLNISILFILPWVFYVVSGYLAVAIAINILLSFMKHDALGDFNYALLPTALRRSEEFLDSEEVSAHFSLKTLWTLKYAIKIFPGVVLSFLLVLCLSTTMYVVEPYQQAAVYRFGTLRESSIVGQGFHFKLPWPIDKADIYDVERLNFVQIGYESTDAKDYLWTKAHDGGEYILLLGNGNEVVCVNIKLMYRINDLYNYVNTSSNPEDILSAAAYESLMRRTINTTLDDIISYDRSTLANSLTEEMAAFCQENNLGIMVNKVIIESIHPPLEVADVYQSVVTASVDKSTIIIQAETEADKNIIDAERQYKTVTDYAKANQYERVSLAQKEMAVYYAAMEAYEVNPDSFQLVRYLQTYETVMGGNKVYVFSPGMEGEMNNVIIGGGNSNSVVIQR